MIAAELTDLATEELAEMDPTMAAAIVEAFQAQQKSSEAFREAVDRLRDTVGDLKTTVAVMQKQQEAMAKSISDFEGMHAQFSVVRHKVEHQEARQIRHSDRLDKLERSDTFLSGSRALAAYLIGLAVSIGALVVALLR